MDDTGATTNGDGRLKRDQKQFSDAKEHHDDTNGSATATGDPWAKASISSCSVNVSATADKCGMTKLPEVELIIHDPSATTTSNPDKTGPVNEFARASGESVLKRLASVANPASVDDSTPQVVKASALVIKDVSGQAQANPFLNATQVTLRADGVNDSTGKKISAEPLIIQPIAQIAQPSQTAKVAAAVDGAPVVQTSALLIKENPTPSTTVAFTDRSIAINDSKALANPALSNSGLISDTKAAVTNTATTTGAASDTKSATAVVATTTAQNPFQAASQVTLRTDGINDSAGKKVVAEPLVIQPVGQIVQTGQTTRTGTAMDTVPVVQASALVIKENPVVSTPSDSKSSTTISTAAGDTKAAAGNSISSAAGDVKPATVAATQTQNPFQAASQVTLRTDGINDAAGKRVVAEPLVIQPVGQIVQTGQTTRSGASIDATPVVQASALVIKENPGVSTPSDSKSSTTISTATGDTKAAAGNSISAAAGDIKAATVAATQTQNPFQAASQVTLRTDGINDAAGKRVVAEPLVIQPAGQIVQNGQTTRTGTAMDTAPVVQASALVIKENPGFSITNDSKSITAISTAAGDAKAAAGDAKAATVAATQTQNPFQAASQVTLRTDGINDAAGKRVVAEPLVIQPVGQIMQTGQANRTGTAIDTAPVVQASALVIKENPGVSTPSDSKSSTTISTATGDTKAAAGNSISAAAGDIKAATVAATQTQNPFQAASQVTLRTDGINDAAGKRVVAEPLVIQPAGQIVQNGQTNRTGTAMDNAPVVQASALVIKENPGVSTASDSKSSTTISTAAGDAKAATVAATQTQNPFQAASQVTLRTDGINDAAGKRVVAEPLVIQPVGQIMQTGQTTRTGTAMDTAPVVQASALVIKENPGVSTPSDSKSSTTISTAVGDAKAAAGDVKAATVAATQTQNPTVLATRENSGAATLPTNERTTNVSDSKPGVTVATPTNEAKVTGAAIMAATQALGHKVPVGEFNMVPPLQLPLIQDKAEKPVTLLDKLAQTSLDSHGPNFANAKNAQTIVDKLQIAAGANAPKIFEPAKTDAIKTDKIDGATKSSKVEIANNIAQPELKPLIKGTKKEKDESENEDGDELIAKTARNRGFGGGGATSVSSNTTVAGQTSPNDPAAITLGVASMPLAPTTLPPLEIIADDKGVIGGKEQSSRGEREQHGNEQKNNEPKDKEPKDRRLQSRKEFDEAIQMLAEKRRIRQAAKKQQPKPPKPTVYKPDKQRRCLILKGDTLESLAQQYLGDKDLAELIYEINKGYWRERKQAGTIVLEIIPGSTIFLPTVEEIRAYRVARGNNRRSVQKFEYQTPAMVRSLRQALKSQIVEATVEDTEPVNLVAKNEDEEDTVIVATRPVIYTASAAVTVENPLLQAAQRLSAPLNDAARVLKPGQGRELNQVEVNSRVVSTGDWSEQSDSQCSARIEVLCDGNWAVVMEYCVDGEGSLKVHSLSGKIQNIPLDLPAAVIKSMALNDLEYNRLTYSKKYLLGRKIFG